MNGTKTVVAIAFVAAGFLALSPTPGAQKASASTSATSVPSFLEVNRTYTFRWQPGDVEQYKVLEIKDGWIKGESQTKDAPARMVLWVNPAQALTIKQEP
ncbi:MAG: hypothetical protein LC753_12075 [Acidobacteria bacterium]|nr:hypothetical protein [Acidobacteriota bacterium]